MLFEVAITLKKEDEKEQMIKDSHSIIADSSQKAAMLAFQKLETNEDIDDLMFYIRQFVSTGFDDNKNDAFVVTSNSNVGLGTNSPNTILTLNNAVTDGYTGEIMSGSSVISC